MFRRDKDSRLDNEGLRRMREAIRQRIEQEEGETTEETTTEESPRRSSLPTLPAVESYIPPPTSYEPLAREGASRETDYSFLSTPRQERLSSPVSPALPERVERVDEAAFSASAPVLAVEGPMVTTVAHDTAWRGTLRSTTTIRIEGQFEGEIITDQDLLIAPEARVEATVQATSIIVAGQLSGQINCRERLEVLPAGRVSGQIDAGRFVVHEGAFLGGQVRMRAPGEETGNDGENRPVLQRVR